MELEAKSVCVCKLKWKYCMCVTLVGITPHTLCWSNTHFWPAEWKQYQNLICHWVVQAWWNVMKQHCWLPTAILLCDWYFLLFPLGYWFSFFSVELVGPVSRPLLLPAAPCQHYFTEDAPVHTEYTPTVTHTQQILCVLVHIRCTCKRTFKIPTKL